MQTQNEEKIFYECDGEIQECREEHCYKRNPSDTQACRHTSDINHAKNFYKRLNGNFMENKPWTLNDVRREHGLPPVQDGDDYLFREVGTEYLPIARVADGERISKITEETGDLP